MDYKKIAVWVINAEKRIEKFEMQLLNSSKSLWSQMKWKEGNWFQGTDLSKKLLENGIIIEFSLYVLR